MISTDPLAPGSVYAASVDDQGKVGLYRLEVGCSPGTGKLKIAGGIEGPMKESIQRAFAYLQGQKGKMGIAQQVDTTDFHVEAIDLLSNRVPCEAGIALVVAIYSAVKRHSVQPGLMILGDLSIQGNIKSVKSLAEPLQVGMDNGARRALIPLENKRNFLEVSGDIDGAGRSDLLLRPDDGGDEGAGDDVTVKLDILRPDFQVSDRGIPVDGQLLKKRIERFRTEYLNTPIGREHLRWETEEPKEVQAIYEKLESRQKAGEDITDDTLRQLLPAPEYQGQQGATPGSARGLA